MTTALSLVDVSLAYGPLMAVRNASLSLEQGGMLFLSGPNGAGKSTLLRAIAGTLAPRQGVIELWGQPTRKLTPEQRVALGFTLVPEGREIFFALSVEENLRLGAYLRRDRDAVAADFDLVMREFPALAQRRRDPAGLLSGGQQQMLTIGRALMTGARLIAVDEPSLGLAPKVIDQIYDILAELRSKRQLTLLIAEQSFLRAVEMGADLCIVRNGRIVRQGSAIALAGDASLESSFFGFDAHSSVTTVEPRQ